jgi:ribbon-helix-helix CopG family protein
MKKTSNRTRPPSAESLARKADKGQDISSYFTNKGRMMPPLDRNGIDLGDAMLEEVDQAAKRLKVSRQALIKQFIRRGLDEQYRSQKQRKVG